MDMIKARLTRLENGEALRTDSVEGGMFEMPVEGRGLRIFGKALTFGSRVVFTSSIKQGGIEELAPGVLKISTENSVYKLEILGEGA